MRLSRLRARLWRALVICALVNLLFPKAGLHVFLQETGAVSDVLPEKMTEEKAIALEFAHALRGGAVAKAAAFNAKLKPSSSLSLE